MKESDIRLRINHVLRKYDYWPITQTDAQRCPKCSTLTHPPKGRPDILCLHPLHRSIVVEVKALRHSTNKSLPFNVIEQHQRDWLNRWQEANGLGYIGLGIVGKAGSRDKLLDLFLIDWPVWKGAETTISKHQKSWPYEPFKGMRRGLDPRLCMINFLEPHRIKSGMLPPTHTAI